MAAIFIAGWLQVAFGQNLGDGLVAYYPFNGNANDESGNGNHLESISGEIGYDNDRFGQSNSTASINKTKLSPINFNGFPKGKDNFTVSTWVNIDDRNPKVSAVIFANSKINGFQLGFNSSEYKEAPNSIGANAENPTPEFYLGETAVFKQKIHLFKSGSLYNKFGDLFALICFVIFIIIGPLKCILKF